MYISVKQVAARYGIDTATVWRWCKADAFPQPIRLGLRVTRWAIADLEAHDAKKIGSTR
jgi:predicted DNA-binding transcriptional regulator AlpA